MKFNEPEAWMVLFCFAAFDLLAITAIVVHWCTK